MYLYMVQFRGISILWRPRTPPEVLGFVVKSSPLRRRHVGGARWCTTGQTEGVTSPLEQMAIEKRERSLFDETAFPFGVRDNADARLVAQRLLPQERRLIFDALRKSMEDQYLEHKRLGQAEIHLDDMTRLWYIYFVPQCVLGLIDTSTLIFAAEYISEYLTGVYTLSLMGAAGTANVISNVLMHPASMLMEKLIARFGIRRPVLSAEQQHTVEFKWIVNGAKVLGILLGSILGLFPLLFTDFPNMESKKKAEHQPVKEKSPTPGFARSFHEEASVSYDEAQKAQKKRELVEREEPLGQEVKDNKT